MNVWDTQNQFDPKRDRVAGHAVRQILVRWNNHGVADLRRLNINHQHFDRRLYPIALKSRGIEIQINIVNDYHVDCSPSGANHLILAEKGGDASLPVHKLRIWAILVVRWQFCERFSCCHVNLMTIWNGNSWDRCGLCESP